MYRATVVGLQPYRETGGLVEATPVYIRVTNLPEAQVTSE